VVVPVSRRYCGSVRHRILALLSLSAFLLVPTGAQAQSKEQRRLTHKVEQALLYVNMKLPQRAKEELETLVATEPGKSDALTWLALSKAQFALQALDDAGASLNRANGLKVEDRLAEKKWAKTYYERINELVGGVRIRDTKCDTVTFRARLAAPMVNREKRALLEALPGWRKKEFQRSTDRPFYLPTGQYKLGETKVKIIPGQETSVTAQEIGAECSALPAAVASQGKTGSGGQVTGSAPPPAGGSGGGFMADNWLWVVLGAVAVAGGTTAAVVVATQDSGPDRFRQVF